MTTRPGGAALALLTSHRQKRLCHLIHVERTDGTSVYWTDHDRAITDPNLEGPSNVYVPAIFAGMSAEKRAAALETPEQKAIGVIDGETMTIPDLFGQRYRGASVTVRVIDWKWPWRVFATYRKTVRKVDWDGLRFVATLIGPTAPLERKAGGRFRGVAAFECPYVLGDAATCKADVSPWRVVGARIGVLNDLRYDFEFTTTSFPTAEVDDFYRYGEFRPLWGPPTLTGTTTGTTTTTTLTAAGSPGWETDAYVGQTVRVLSSAAGPVVGWAKITANNANSVTYVDTNANMSGHGVSPFDIAPDSANLGLVAEIEAYTAATRRVELFAPAPFDFLLLDSGIVEVGCDGLFSTCDTKFANSLNFGGVHTQPKAADQWEVT